MTRKRKAGARSPCSVITFPYLPILHPNDEHLLLRFAKERLRPMRDVATRYTITRVERNEYTIHNDTRRYTVTQPSLTALPLRRRRALIFADLSGAAVLQSTKRATGRHWDILFKGQTHTLTMHTARWAHIFYFDLEAWGRCALTYNPLLCDVRAERSDSLLAKVACGGSRKVDAVEVCSLQREDELFILFVIAIAMKVSHDISARV